MKTPINGINIAYTDSGQGHPLVFIHAFPLSHEMWKPQVAVFEQQYRVITLDLRGHGESDTQLWNFTLEDYAKDVYELLCHLDIHHATFIGLSMGGYTLLAFYRQFPAMVSALVLADTRAQADNEEGKAGRLAMAQTAHTQGPTAIADLMIPKLLSATTTENRKDLVEEVRTMILKNQSAGIIVDLMAMAARPDSTSLLSKISCPTLVIVGENDVATPPSESHYMAERIPQGQLVTISHAGHISNYEQPETFNQALKTFLSGNIQGKGFKKSENDGMRFRNEKE
ncbi:MAG: alpha/beta hydrolase [Nitrospirales bacterium]|nr:MAG: alpha/beta hydrolase [Nitrospirales bacterium]